MKYREIYLGAKSDKIVDESDRSSVRSSIFGDEESIDAYAILSFGLIYSPSAPNLERLLYLSRHYAASGDDDRLRACFTSGCVYWNACDAFEDLSKKIIDEPNIEVFQETVPVAAMCLSKLAAENRSTTVLNYLVSSAHRSISIGAGTRAEVLVNAALKAATGKKWIKGSEVSKFFDANRLRLIRFGMDVD